MMRIRRFEAPTVQEALQQVRSTLGPDAVILYTKKLRKGGLFGFMGNDIAEITAGLDDAVEPAMPVVATTSASMTMAASVTKALGAAPESPSRGRTAATLPARPRRTGERPEVFQSELNDRK